MMINIITFYGGREKNDDYYRKGRGEGVRKL